MKLGVNTHFIILDFWLDTLEWQLEKRLIPYWKESTVGLDEATVRAYIRHQEEQEKRQLELGLE